ncbi:recombinase family protein [Klebsiella pneumoniae]|uniref:recombinase family protein n=1 Tax=Klebsiella pneumoniae TaxID=573 RepID=UPI00124F654A|nr:recombinase family protein [Klebsiella pneumoniae]QFH40439.1 recombinase family protein [Klebsiella pneumoniae]
MPQLYSYIRWSSERQQKGTTRQRQVIGAKEFAIANGLELVEIEDPGVSAFRGKNTTHGKLGDFIDAVRQGAIPPDSWLYVENLDRLTRQEVTTAQKLFIELLDLGLTLVTGMDKRVYTLESVNKNPTDLMISLLLFSRANEESKTKQARTIGNVESLIERHRQGLPVNIKSCGKHPFWIDDSGSQYESVKRHAIYWEIAREAIELFLSGYGIYKVRRFLDEKYPNGLNGKEWGYQVLKKMRESRALIGERQINIGSHTYTLRDYYPCLCKNEVEFLHLQELKGQNSYKSKKNPLKEQIKLLSGLAILRCSKCGGTMSSFMNKGKPRYICLNGRHLQKGCVGWSLTAPLVDHCVIIALLMGYMDANRKERQDTSDISALIEAKNTSVGELNVSITNLVAVIEAGVNVSELASRLKVLSTERETFLKEIERLKERKALIDSKGSFEVSMMDFINLIHWNVFSDYAHESRDKIRSTINKIIEHVIIDKTDGCITIKIKCRGSDEQLIFCGIGRKPHWKFDIALYVEQDTDGDTTFEEKSILPMANQLMEEATKQFALIREGYISYFDKICKILAAIGYPNIDGSAFWPNR